METPTPCLIVVSGPYGFGKTTLAHNVARRIGCPAICRDEIKEGMVFSAVGYEPQPGDPLTRQASKTFFDVLQLLVRAGVTVVAEAAFQGHVWHPALRRLAPDADIRVIQCKVDAAIAHARMTERDLTKPVHRAAHGAPDPAFTAADWQGISLDVPILHVETSDGYDPGLDAIVAFCGPGPVIRG